MNRAALWWIPPVAWAVTIFILSSTPSRELPMPTFFEADKVLHFGAFGLLSALLRQAFAKTYTWPARTLTLAAFFVTVVYGFLDEVHQGLGVAGRVADPFDWFADIAGALVATPLHAWVTRPAQETT